LLRFVKSSIGLSSGPSTSEETGAQPTRRLVLTGLALATFRLVPSGCTLRAMESQSPSPEEATPLLLPIAAIAFAVAIFIIDTFTPLGIAVAVLYAVVVLMAGSFLQRRGVLIVASSCLAVTGLSYLLQHGETYGPALGRCLVSLAAIGITTFLALKRQSADTALRQSEAYLAEAQRLSRTGSWAWDVASRRNLHWSPETYRIFAFDPEKDENSFQAARDRIHPEDRPKFDREIERASKEGTDFEVDFRVVLPDGEVKYIHTVGHPVLNTSGDVVELIGTNMDVTAAQRAQQQLHEAQAELSHVTRITTLGELTASIAHEVSQPLAAVVTNADSCLRWLGRETPELGEARGALERIIRDAHRATEVIQRIRDLATKTELQRAQLDINAALRESLLLVQREVLNKRVSLQLELASVPLAVLGDRVQLQQVIINLVMNGIEAMAKVTDRPRQLMIGSRQHDANQVLVAIQDSGAGIDPENVDRLFAAFFTTKPGGMGMGLSICRSIIEAHEGRLWASRNDGPGATFQFTLPVFRESVS
jgi:PAS domain S-box-containing protein